MLCKNQGEVVTSFIDCFFFFPLLAGVGLIGAQIGETGGHVTALSPTPLVCTRALALTHTHMPGAQTRGGFSKSPVGCTGQPWRPPASRPCAAVGPERSRRLCGPRASGAGPCGGEAHTHSTLETGSASDPKNLGRHAKPPLRLDQDAGQAPPAPGRCRWLSRERGPAPWDPSAGLGEGLAARRTPSVSEPCSWRRSSSGPGRACRCTDTVQNASFLPGSLPPSLKIHLPLYFNCTVGQVRWHSREGKGI